MIYKCKRCSHFTEIRVLSNSNSPAFACCAVCGSIEVQTGEPVKEGGKL